MANDSAELLPLRLSLALGFSACSQPGLGHRLMEADVPAESWFQLDSEGLRERGIKGRIASRLLSDQTCQEAKALLAETRRAKLGLLWRAHPCWPRSLLGLPDQAFALWYRGDIGLLQGSSQAPTCLAIVGTRQPSPYGIHATRAFTQAVALTSTPIVSGLARGIDSMAHRACLDADGRTIAVMGSGLQAIYPPEHARLAQHIIETGGLILSEYPPTYRAQRWTFPRRNRILAAISTGLLVIEAPRRSGALISADFANSYGRPVWALPGQYSSASSEGCHKLIREGALLADSPAGLVKDMGLSLPGVEATRSLTVSGEAAVLEILRAGPKPVEAIATAMTQELAETFLQLQRLEASGLIEFRSGGLYFHAGTGRATHLRNTSLEATPHDVVP